MNWPLWNTQNDLAEKIRTGAVELLNQQLADALDLALQAKQAHWNVKGPSFISAVRPSEPLGPLRRSRACPNTRSRSTPGVST
jgi:ferritin-like protein